MSNWEGDLEEFKRYLSYFELDFVNVFQIEEKIAIIYTETRFRMN